MVQSVFMGVSMYMYSKRLHALHVWKCVIHIHNMLQKLTRIKTVWMAMIIVISFYCIRYPANVVFAVAGAVVFISSLLVSEWVCESLDQNEYNIRTNALTLHTENFTKNSHPSPPTADDREKKKPAL